jgi:hypothetical membrane protein
MLLVCGIVGPLLFIVVFLIEGVTRPGYSAWRHFVSSLATSDQGWEQIVNFIVCGFLIMAFAVGLRLMLRTGKGALWGPIFIGLFGLALIMAGIFVADPTLDYPPGASRIQTLHGTLHGLAGVTTFFSVSLASFVMARRFAGHPGWKGWTFYSILVGIIVLASFFGANVTAVLDITGSLPNAPTGLVQRIGIVAGWTWTALLAWRLLRDPHLAEPAQK